MKNLKISLSYFLLAAAVCLMISCSKKSDNPVDPGNVINAEANLTLNGAGYTNTNVKFGNGACAFSPAENLTVVQFSGTIGSDSLIFVFQFIGNQTGARSWRSTEPDALLLKYGSSGQYYFYADSVGTTTVSNYGTVNNKVDGSINGKLIEATSQAELNITGSFSAVRIPDVQ